ncbi:sodium- and chloride-dependent neutral and basic amino acid transporter B(0+)-like [Physella acuta]|uniref:sodium- and chloride-dependent neutral and basic amino acid transporter B(0+)-like n=1 Tax=Physella acuta TaxID=109671 RepID=UPI0027DC146C|nr:sodium- and chloride-dependent neutral and basic amino acid transporter B(0+)-like [Physella acuta]
MSVVLKKVQPLDRDSPPEYFENGYHPNGGHVTETSAGYKGNGYTPSDGADSEVQSSQGTEAEDERGQWGNKAEFVLSCIGLSVGLGNVWRFPYLAYQNGGAAFLIAYIILQLLIGKPMYFMELVMGQYSGRGPTKVWEMNPCAKGVGISMCLISLVVAIYYNIIMAYTLYFFFASMQETLPWSVCTEQWIQDYNCVSKLGPPLQNCTMNATLNGLLGNCLCTGTTDQSVLPGNMTCTTPTSGPSKSPAQLYFYKEVIQKSAGVEPENMGAPLWKLTLCLILSWVVVVFCLIKGIKSSGKVVYFTATFPYVILLILLVRGALLDGAKDGVDFFIIPDWEKLKDIQVWVAAAGQMFFSLSVSFGGIIMFGSYNKFNNMVYYDSLLISFMDLITSVIAGFVVFTTFGGMAKIVGKKVSEVADGGYGMAFVVYPEALSNLPPSQLWSILFFFMLFTLGLDSEFGLMETVLTCIQDEFPKTRRYKSAICVGLAIACFFLALPCTCPGGDYVVSMMDHYGADFSVLFVSCIEVVSVMWVYGVMRFLNDIKYMLGARPHGWPYWVFCWAVSAPLLIAAMFMYRMVRYKPPTYDNGDPIPMFAQSIGWTLLSVVLCPIPLWFLWKSFTSWRDPAVTSFSKWRKSMFEPTTEWAPNDKKAIYRPDDPTKDVIKMEAGVENPVPVTDDYAEYKTTSFPS